MGLWGADNGDNADDADNGENANNRNHRADAVETGFERAGRVGGIDDAGEGRWHGFWSQPGEPTSPGHMN